MPNKQVIQQIGPDNTRRSAIAIDSAKAFWNLAEGFLLRLPPTLDDAGRYAVAHRGELSAAATNLVFALELYLKGLALGTGTKVPKNHDLLELFDLLPEPLRKGIEQDYDARRKLVPPNAVTALDMLFTPTPAIPADAVLEQAQSGRPKGIDIRSVLAAEKNAFKTWRYLYEAGALGEIQLLRIDYGRLTSIIESLEATIYRPGGVGPIQSIRTTVHTKIG